APGYSVADPRTRIGPGARTQKEASMGKRRWLTGEVLALLGGCLPPSEEAVKEFNEAIQAANRKVEAAVARYGKAIDRALHGSASDVVVARKEYEEACQDLQQVLTEARAIKVPSSGVARSLYAAHQAFLKSEEAVFRNDYAAILRIVEEN